MMRWVVLILTLLITVGCLFVWGATGRHYYTKYQVVEQVAVEVAADDPLAAAGFYDDQTPPVQTVIRDEFHFGLLPTPRGLFDKHMLSLLTVISPLWAAVVVTFGVRHWRGRGHRNRRASDPQFQVPDLSGNTSTSNDTLEKEN